MREGEEMGNKYHDEEGVVSVELGRVLAGLVLHLLHRPRAGLTVTNNIGEAQRTLFIAGGRTIEHQGTVVSGGPASTYQLRREEP